MTAQVLEKPKPRVEQERQRRRRRETLGDERNMNLAVTVPKDPNYEYRWVNDRPGRVHKLTVGDDWEIVNDELRDEKDRGVGTGIERVGDKRSGQRVLLMRKPKDYCEEDRAAAQADLDEVDRSLGRGMHKSPEALSGSAAYVPEGGIVIKDGRKR